MRLTQSWNKQKQPQVERLEALLSQTHAQWRRRRRTELSSTTRQRTNSDTERRLRRSSESSTNAREMNAVTIRLIKMNAVTTQQIEGRKTSLREAREKLKAKSRKYKKAMKSFKQKKKSLEQQINPRIPGQREAGAFGGKDGVLERHNHSAGRPTS
jgi:septin family protein